MSGYVGMKPRIRRPIIDRFAEKVALDDNGCWIWTSVLNPNGYGIFWVVDKNRLAHRWSYEYHVGPIPEGLYLDHLCRTPACVNPDHLEPVTNRENQRRGVGPVSDLIRRTHCPEGHPLSGDNLMPTYLKRGWRYCRECRREYDRQRRRKARAS